LGHRLLDGVGVASALADWALIAVVIGLVIVTFFVIAGFVDELVEYWRAYRDDS
jgi:hypothetical protein